MPRLEWLTRVLGEQRRERLDRLASMLRLDLKLAIRNVLRQTRRSGLGLFAVTAGVVALMLAAGFFEWNYDGMREGIIRSRLGHAQVSKKGFFEGGSADPFVFLIPETSEDRKLIEASPDVVAVAPRLHFNGLISVGESTVAFVGQGVAPDREKRLSGALRIAEGRDLEASDSKEVLLGKGLAENLGVKVGQRVVLLAGTRTRGVSAVEVLVVGVFVTSTKAYDDYALRLPLRTTQTLLQVEGVHNWLVLLDKTSRTDAVVDRLRPKLTNPDIVLTPWHQLAEADFYNKTVELFSRQVSFLRILVGLIIVLSISNTLMNNVRERIGEIGTSMALGDTRSTVRRRFLVEGAVMGFTGGLLGVILGTIAAILISKVGIPMPPPPGMSIGYRAGINITPGIAINALFLATTTAFLAGLYPATMAARMPIVDALRHAR